MFIRRWVRLWLVWCLYTCICIYNHSCVWDKGWGNQCFYRKCLIIFDITMTFSLGVLLMIWIHWSTYRGEITLTVACPIFVAFSACCLLVHAFIACPPVTFIYCTQIFLVLLNSTILNYIKLYHVIPNYTMPYPTIPYHTQLSSAMLCYSNTLPYQIYCVWCGVVLCYAVWCHTCSSPIVK